MPILDQDVGIYTSERLTDFPDGGGRITAKPMVDGQSNNLFPDQSDLDETTGRLKLRKFGVAVRTDDTEPYLGALVFVSKPPFNKKVSATLFQTGAERHFDERIDAQRRLESYLTPGSESRYTLLNDQLEGQRMLFAFGREDVPAPDIGTSFCLDDTVTGDQQFVRITDVSSEVRTYEDASSNGSGVYKKRVFIMSISTRLKRNFIGSEVDRLDANIRPQTILRVTQVADAAQYAGVQEIVEPVGMGDMSVKAESLFSQLVPSSTIETNIPDESAGSTLATLIQAGNRFEITVSIIDGVARFGRPITPGSLYCVLGVDDGKGGVFNNGVQTGDVDYNSGDITFYSNTGNVTLMAAPALQVTPNAHTESIKIEAANRGYNYIRTLRPIPDSRGIAIDYMSQGKWYRLLPDVNGGLRDEVGSVAQIDRLTGTVIITLAALPDVGTYIIITWAGAIHYESNAGFEQSFTPFYEGQVTEAAITPNSLSIEWLSGGVTKTATDDGYGNITGDANGRVIYSEGKWGFSPNDNCYPDAGANLQLAYDSATIVTEVLDAIDRTGDMASFQLTQGPVKQGSLVARWTRAIDKEGSTENSRSGSYRSAPPTTDSLGSPKSPFVPPVSITVGSGSTSGPSWSSPSTNSGGSSRLTLYSS